MKKIMTLVILLCCCIATRAQLLSDKIDEQLYKTRVKLIDEFFDRFNGKEGRLDVKPGDSQYREKNLLLLFDGALFKNNRAQTLAGANGLIEAVIRSKTQLSYTDSTWFARAVCKGKYKNRDVSFTLYLTVESRGRDMYKWVIARAEGSIFKLTPSKTSDRIMIMPDDHETNFMSLHRITTEKDDYITNYVRKGRHVDQTSVFLSYVYSGLLNIDHVSSLEFTFLQVPGYVFTVRDIFRETFNSGWLIASFRKATDAEKQQIMNRLKP